MSAILSFDVFVNSFKSCHRSFEHGLLSVNTENLNASTESFVESLRYYGVNGDINVIDNEIIFNYSELRSGAILYSSLDTFWRWCSKENEVPTKYLVLKEAVCSLCEDIKVSKIIQYINWAKVLLLLSNHDIIGKAIWFVPDDDGGKEVVINIPSSLSNVFDLNFEDSSLSSAKHLLNMLTLDDAQAGERKALLRKAIYDYSKEDPNINAVINSGERVYNRYNDLLELYTKRFSVDKILSEIESKNLEYTTKINDFISASQSKAFTIPGALIAVGALAKVEGFWSGCLILCGLVMIYIITKASNDVQRETYQDLKISLVDVFKRYIDFDEKTEIKKRAVKTSASLSNKIDCAVTRLNKIDGLAFAMIVIGLVYLVFK